ncbi:XdhC family protein [Aliiroseovarius crassostreae]|uniref:XdhC family protein n=1 Tax=Aliiroseovarius crassostreae TaxID=154981 RepID=UPI0021FBB39A|nr:XdhC/CoxI family protein [Aliiroseovarius crassostreae]UWQ05499.1 XdhC family protein [Aliiroseovarius crassostreae]
MTPSRFDRIPEIALEWHRADRAVAIATVVATWGSAPRPVGSQMVVALDGAIEGSVSGGCVEAAVVVAAQEAIGQGRPRLLTFGVSSEDAFAAGLACGGEITVMVEPVGAQGAGQGLSPAMLDQIVKARSTRAPLAYRVGVRDWSRQIAVADPEDVTGLEGACFTHLHHPPLRLVIVGAVHVAQALIPMAQAVGYDIALIDPRSAFATEDRFPGVALHVDFPEDVLPAIGLDAHTALVTLAHDPKIDDPALDAALGSEAFYIGSLGAKRTQAQRLERLAARGVSAENLSRIHGPVGLDIGAVGPAEIAVSILAELVARRRLSRR